LSQENAASSSEGMNTTGRSVSNLSPIDFPLLSSLGVHSNFMDKLLQELVKFYGQKTIEYVGSNNCNVCLISFPSLRKINRYDTELSKKGSVIDEMVNNVAKSSCASEIAAAECLIYSLFNRFEEQFISVAIDKGILHSRCKKWMQLAWRRCLQKLA
jgi:hypothetical protein